MSDREVFNLVRAQVSPLRGAYIEHDGRRVHFDAYMTPEEIGALRERYRTSNPKDADGHSPTVP